MNNKTTIMLAIAGCLTITQLGYASGRDTVVKTILNCVGYVTGGCVTGDITMGGAGQPIAIDTTGVPVESYGRISGLTQKRISIPAQGKKIFSFTPTLGSYANQQIKALIYTLDLSQPFPADAPSNMVAEANRAKADPALAGKINTVTGVFRQGPNETNWTPFYAEASSDTPADLSGATPIRLILYAHGKVIAYLPSFTDTTGKKVSAPPLQLELGMTLAEVEALKAAQPK